MSSNKKSVQCAICGQRYQRITKAHVKTHGLSLAQYKKIYGAVKPVEEAKELAEKAVTSDEVADLMLSNPEIRSGLADGLVAHLFGPGTRARLLSAISVVLEARMAQFSELTAAKAKVVRELFKDWRIKEGGPDGGPTSTKDLITMLATIGNEQSATEGTLIRVLQQAVSERKAPMQLLLGIGLHGNAFTGRHEAVANLSQSQREQARMLDESLGTGDPDKVAGGLLMAAVITPEEYEQETGSKPTKKMLDAYDKNRKYVVEAEAEVKK